MNTSKVIGHIVLLLILVLIDLSIGSIFCEVLGFTKGTADYSATILGVSGTLLILEGCIALMVYLERK